MSSLVELGEIAKADEFSTKRAAVVFAGGVPVSIGTGWLASMSGQAGENLGDRAFDRTQPLWMKQEAARIAQLARDERVLNHTPTNQSFIDMHIRRQRRFQRVGRSGGVALALAPAAAAGYGAYRWARKKD